MQSFSTTAFGRRLTGQKSRRRHQSRCLRGYRQHTLSFATSVILSLAPLCAARAQTTITIDMNVNQAAINQNIYGVNYNVNYATANNDAAPSASDSQDMRPFLVRFGGNLSSTYNWQTDVFNHGLDYFFESFQDHNGYNSGQTIDNLISQLSFVKGGNAMVTVPIGDWVAKRGDNSSLLSSFSVSRYGSIFTGADGDSGNGITGTSSQGRYLFFTGNDKNDANTPNSVAFQQQWVQHLVDTYGTTDNGGIGFYALDNEPDDWFEEHADVDPTGVTLTDLQTRLQTYAAAIKSVDPTALTTGPEISGWYSYFYSGYDLQKGAQKGDYSFPDRNTYGTDPSTRQNYYFLPKLLSALKANDAGKAYPTLDVFTVHYYPQGSEYSDDVSNDTQLLRNRSTRSLWDQTYVDESFIGQSGLPADGTGTPGIVQLLPRLRGLIARYYPGLQTGVTEYSWGADGHMNGATAEADILGILGRGYTINGTTFSGADMASRFYSPASNSPVYQAIKLMRTAGDQGFGNTSVSCTTDSNTSPDNLSTFASYKYRPGADPRHPSLCTVSVMVVNKRLPSDTAGTTSVNFNFTPTSDPNLSMGSSVAVYQLAAVNGDPTNAAITQLTSLPAANNHFSTSVPPQSVTIFQFDYNSNPKTFPARLGTLIPLVGGKTIAPPSSALRHPATVKLLVPGTSTVVQQIQNVTPDGTGAFNLTAATPGTYDVAIKPRGCLQKIFRSVTFSASSAASLPALTLILGDVNNDNSIDASDYSVVLSNYGKIFLDASFNPAADLNGDGVVDSTDIAIIKANLRQKGDQ